jgi:hypothetical protein
MFDTPILILGFNRPDLFADLLDNLRDLSPTNIYIAVDGPREGNKEDVTNVEETISSIELIDWSCNIKILKRNLNLGCGRAVSSAISWVMETESKVIILEDDIRPNKSFFEFCSKALTHFEDDERIMTIGGHSLIELPNQTDKFRLSMYPEIWGWATWKRSWEQYEFSLQNLPKINFRKLLSIYGGNFVLAFQCSMNFRKMRSHMIDTWDYQLLYSSFFHNKFHVLPNMNLTKNVGFNSQATHTKYLPVPSPARKEIVDLNFKNHVYISNDFEKLTRRHMQHQIFTSLKSHIIARIKALVKRHIPIK